MSGILGALGLIGNDADPDNEVMIETNGTRIAGWEAVTITQSAEAFPNSFLVGSSEEFPNDPTRIIAEPGKGQAKVYIGKDLVITGYVDRYEIQTSPTRHEVIISGRGLCQDLVDCSADLPNTPEVTGGMIQATDMVDLATKLCKTFPDIKVKLIGEDKGLALPAFQVMLGESVYDIVERAARYSAFLVYEDETGAMVLARVGTEEMASGFEMPGNVEAAGSVLSIDQRFSDYTVVWSAVPQFAEVSDNANFRAAAKDKTMPRKRPRIIVSSQITLDPAFGQQVADWELARRIGRSQAITLTCDSWRDKDGKLWRPNTLAPIKMPSHKLGNAKWIIGTVTFRKDQGGTHADLVMMPPDAFKPQPSPLNLWNREFLETAQPSQDPKPSSTNDPPAADTSSGGLG